MKQKNLIYCIATACLLAACGDDSSTGPSTNSSGVSQISSSSARTTQTSSAIETSESKDISSSTTTQSSSSKETVTSSASKKDFPANYNPETGLLTDDRDGEVYKTAKVGSQIWMAQSLRYLPKSPADGCEFLWVDETEDPEQLATYGRHYSWLGATRIPCDYMSKTISFGNGDFPLPHQGVCPKGWHIPSIDEWKKNRRNS